MEERAEKIGTFSRGGALDTEGNVQFGEGGAGTFSDGKLNTGTHAAFNREVLETFVSFGAPEEILWLNKPHIGSDNLQKIVVAMREYIINHGGRVAFNARLTDIVVRDGAVTGARISRRDGAALSEEDREVSAIVLAVRAQRAGYVCDAPFPRRGDVPQGFRGGRAHRASAIGNRPGAVR